MPTLSTRRKFLGIISACSVAGFTHTTQARSSTARAAPSDYLFTPGLVYLGTAILGPCPRNVVEATMRAWYDLEANPTAMAYFYESGSVLSKAEEVRGQAARFLGCSTDEIVITRSTTDGMNAIAQGLRLAAGQRVLTTDQEHEGGTFCWEHLARRQGIVIDRVKIPPGENDPKAILERFAAAVTGDTRVISVSHVLTSTGLRMPISEITALARAANVLCVVDGAQAAGGIAVNVKTLGCDAYVTSGHKWLMGPKGTGLLYLRSGVEHLIQAMQFEDGRKFYAESVGVGNLPGAVGLGVAIDSISRTGIEAIERHNLALRNRLYEALKQVRAVTVVSPAPGPLATPLVTFMLPAEIDSEALVKRFRAQHGIVVKRVPKRWLNGIRLSPHIFNTAAEADRFMAALKTELR